jgi:hypothetical protein
MKTEKIRVLIDDRRAYNGIHNSSFKFKQLKLYLCVAKKKSLHQKIVSLINRKKNSCYYTIIDQNNHFIRNNTIKK